MQVIKEIVETCRAHDFTDLILVYEHRGIPDKIVISHLPFGPTATFQILNVVSYRAFLVHLIHNFCFLNLQYEIIISYVCRLRDTTIKTRRKWELFRRLIHI